MMQNMIVLLLLVNLLVLVWTNFKTTPSAQPVTLTESNNLRLFDESTADTAQPHPSLQSDKFTQFPTIASDHNGVLTQPDQPTQAGVLTKLAQSTHLTQSTVAKEAGDETWSTQVYEVLPNTKALPIIEKAGKPTHDSPEDWVPGHDGLSEKTADTRASHTRAEASLCWQIGPFYNKEAAQKAAKNHPKQINLSRIAEEEAVVHMGYIVVVPAKNGLQGAQQTVNQLHAKNMRDTQIMKSGPFLHAVSLGVFQQKANAERLVQQVQQRGVPEVIIRNRTKTKNKYWLELINQDKINHSELLKSTYPDVSVQQIDCK